MKIHRFEDIIAWQKAQDLSVEIYTELKTLKDWDFKNQITRASVSISNNIAEGFERNSDKDFQKFLFYSLASCSEVKSMLYLAKRLQYIGDEKTNFLMINSIEISKILTGLIKSLESRQSTVNSRRS